MPQRILTIDDSMAIRSFIAKTLTQDNPDLLVSSAKDGSEGVTMAATVSPDLILLDFILPDMRGDQVCDLLGKQSATAKIPVMLMSSNAGDMKRTEEAFPCVVKSIAKPFTPELLTATVRHLLREQRITQSQPSVTKTHDGPHFSAHSSAFPIHRAFLVLEEEGLTGRLSIDSPTLQIECYLRNGRVHLVTNRNPAIMLRDSSPLPGSPDEAEKSLQIQRDTGCPVFLSLAQAGLMPLPEALLRCLESGHHLLSLIWTDSRFRYVFEVLSALPDFVPEAPLTGQSMDEFLLSSIRLIPTESLQTAMAWGDLNGIPIYTRHGYERIQQITIDESEAAFLGLIGEATLSQMADSLGWTRERAQAMLFRFLCLRIFEYWPSELLRGE